MAAPLYSFYDDFERSTVLPWRWNDGRNDLIHIESAMSYRGTRCLKLRCGPGSTLIQDASVYLPIHGVVSFEHYFTFNPRFPSTGNTLHSIERRQSLSSTQLLEMQVQYVFANGQLSIINAGTPVLIHTFDNPLEGYDSPSFNAGEPIIDANSPTSDIGDLSWHYFKMVVDITLGKFIQVILDDFTMDLQSFGIGLWNVPGGHNSLAPVNSTRFELHIITDQTSNERNLLVDEVTIRGQP